MNKVNYNQEELSTVEAAKLLKLSRVAIFKKIQSGELKAHKVGKNYIIKREDLENIANPMKSELTDAIKDYIDKSVRKTIKEYGETLRLLGKEDAQE